MEDRTHNTTTWIVVLLVGLAFLQESRWPWTTTTMMWAEEEELLLLAVRPRREWVAHGEEKMESATPRHRGEASGAGGKSWKSSWWSSSRRGGWQKHAEEGGSSFFASHRWPCRLWHAGRAKVAWWWGKGSWDALRGGATVGPRTTDAMVVEGNATDDEGSSRRKGWWWWCTGSPPPRPPPPRPLHSARRGGAGMGGDECASIVLPLPFLDPHGWGEHEKRDGEESIFPWGMACQEKDRRRSG